MGIINVKLTTKHRKWMLRKPCLSCRGINDDEVNYFAGTVAYAAAPATAKLAIVPARYIISDIGSYYAVQPNDLIRLFLKC
jgi:hypothetical protein